MLSVNLLLFKSRKIFLFLVCLAVILIIVEYAVAFQTENVFLVIIDGARYSETFGDETHANVENMHRLSSYGCVNTEFYNNRNTYTKNAVCAILTGRWENFITFYPQYPSIWEYYRKQFNLQQESSYYSFPDNEGFFQPVSYHKEYGSDYWPMRGGSSSNDESWNELKTVMESSHPRLVVLYLGDTDNAGHDEDWEGYLETIKNADEIVGALWEKIQLDQNYQNKTTLIVTNDHGRHDDLHGGFKGHGDACGRCQHIMFLTIGPDFKKNYKTDTRRTLVDITPTLGKLLGFNPEYVKGKVMSELFIGTPIPDQQSVSTDEDNRIKITLAARDPDGDNLTFKIADNPLNGNLSGTPPEIIYTPNTDFNGEDSFTFTANDGKLESIPAKVSITVKPDNN